MRFSIFMPQGDGAMKRLTGYMDTPKYCLVVSNLYYFTLVTLLIQGRVAAPEVEAAEKFYNEPSTSLYKYAYF